MAPKPMVSQKAQIVRPTVSDSSLLYCPDDVLEGFQERIETGIDWTLLEQAAIYHKKKCSRPEIAPVSFAEALEEKKMNSYFAIFYNEESTLTIPQRCDLLSQILWDNKRCNTEEGRICFQHNNLITDDAHRIIKKGLKFNSRDMIKKEFQLIATLRLVGCKMTHLDESLKMFPRLLTLNLCGNYLSTIEGSFLPPMLRLLELQGNAISDVSFAKKLPSTLLYLGLARNFLTNDNIIGLSKLPYQLTALDLSDNDIYHLEPVLAIIVRLPRLTSLTLAGNPCSVSASYARTTIALMPQLQYLDNREILPTDHPEAPIETHPDDLRTAYFYFNVFRVMSIPFPPKIEKGTTQTFHVELEIPFLDAKRRSFLMFRNQESLTEMLPMPEDYLDNELGVPESMQTESQSKVEITEALTEETDVYANMITPNPWEIIHYTIFETNKVGWNKMINFQEPSVRIFCPDLVALRNTFRTVITLRLVFTQTTSGKQPLKPSAPTKSGTAMKPASLEQRVVLATIRCVLQRFDWTQPSQHFHWDDTLGSDEAIHWGDGDLAILQYSNTIQKVGGKGAKEDGTVPRQIIPENLTCQFGFGIETLKPGV